jgi:hypothetical protein
MQTLRVTGWLPPVKTWERICAQLLSQVRGVELPAGWFTSTLPVNWRDRADISLTAAMAALEEGVPLIWVPRGGIVAELAACENSAARDAVLVRERLAIAADCAAVIGEVDRADLAPLLPLAMEVTDAVQAGLLSAGQALAANVFDTWLRDATARGLAFRPGKGGVYRNALGQIGPVSDETLLAELHQICALTPVVVALEVFWSGQPVPGRFSRHATAHRAGPEQYTEPNAITAMMLMASLLRESQESGW